MTTRLASMSFPAWMKHIMSVASMEGECHRHNARIHLSVEIPGSENKIK